jgi:hypothetical protein
MHGEGESSERSEDDIIVPNYSRANMPSHCQCPANPNSTNAFSRNSSATQIEMTGSLGTTALPLWSALLFTYLEPSELTRADLNEHPG